MMGFRRAPHGIQCFLSIVRRAGQIMCKRFSKPFALRGAALEARFMRTERVGELPGAAVAAHGDAFPI